MVNPGKSCDKMNWMPLLIFRIRSVSLKCFSELDPDKKHCTNQEMERRMAGLIATVSAALNLTTRLRELGADIGDAELKNLLADLSLELAGLGLGLAEAELKIADLIYENGKMKEKFQELVSVEGELCPKCKNRTFELISSKPHPTFGEIGYRERQYKCLGCGFAESTIIA